LIKREERFKLEEKSIERLKVKLRKEGFKFTDIGLECWFPKTVHKKIRKIYDNTVVNFIRYLPDLFIYNRRKEIFALAQLKATSPKHRDGENFAIETNALEIDKKLASIGVSVFIVFENYPSKFYGNWAEKIQPFKELPFEYSKTTEGSGTPFSLVKKENVPKITSFLDCLQ